MLRGTLDQEPAGLDRPESRPGTYQHNSATFTVPTMEQTVKGFLTSYPTEIYKFFPTYFTVNGFSGTHRKYWV